MASPGSTVGCRLGLGALNFNNGCFGAGHGFYDNIQPSQAAFVIGIDFPACAEKESGKHGMIEIFSRGS